MRKRLTRAALFALLLCVHGFLSSATPGLAQSGDELAKLRKEIEEIRRDLEDIKALLRARVAPPASQGQPDALAQPVVLNIDGAPFLGSKDAKVTLVEFSDFQCPFCARHSQQTLPTLTKQYIDAGKVKYVLRDFPIPALHPQAQKSHEAAHCAGEQGKYWEMYHRLFGNIRAHDAQELSAHARAIRLDVHKFDQCLTTGRHVATVQKAVAEGERAGVRGTPTFFIGASGDGRTVKATRMLRGAQPYDRFKAVIDVALGEARPPR